MQLPTSDCEHAHGLLRPATFAELARAHWQHPAQPALAEVLPQQPDWRHLKVEDGPGRALGRSFRVKLWPTLILLRDGVELARVVRPTQADGIRQSLQQTKA